MLIIAIKSSSPDPICVKNSFMVVYPYKLTFSFQYSLLATIVLSGKFETLKPQIRKYTLINKDRIKLASKKKIIKVSP